jgi:hypothetical protein
MKIQPITTWFNGEPQTATNFTLRSIADNLTTSATLYYELQKELVSEVIEPKNSISNNGNFENLITATLDISGQDYKDWSATPDANTWIYNWAAGKLNLVLITE